MRLANAAADGPLLPSAAVGGVDMADVRCNFLPQCNRPRKRACVNRWTLKKVQVSLMKSDPPAVCGCRSERNETQTKVSERWIERDAGKRSNGRRGSVCRKGMTKADSMLIAPRWKVCCQRAAGFGRGRRMRICCESAVRSLRCTV